MPELKVIVIDSREKPDVIKPIKKQFDQNGYEYITRGLLVGDYCFYHNPQYVIDRKHSVDEICQNVCSRDHKRFRRELEKVAKLGFKITILIEDGKYKNIEDLRNWVNPRRAKNLRSPSGDTLFKALDTIAWRYNVDFVFCSEKETGRRIIELLEEHDTT